MQTRVRNQQNPPLPKKKRVDLQGNDRRRVYAKSGTATLLVAQNLTQNAADMLIESIKSNTKRLGGITSCTFIIAR